jgi:hypothetical protein
MYTAKQFSFATSLGLTLSPDTTREQASALITQALASRESPKTITDRMKAKRFAVGARHGWKGSELDEHGFAYANLQIDLLESLSALDDANNAGDTAAALMAVETLVNKVRVRLTTPVLKAQPVDAEPAPF